MAHRRKPLPNPDYEVGYGKPPKHSQFKKGQSGNPKGRRKGSRDTASIVHDALEKPVKVREGDKVRTRTAREVMIDQIVAKAVKGDLKSAEFMIRLMIQCNHSLVTPDPERAASAAEIELFEAMIRMTGGDPARLGLGGCVGDDDGAGGDTRRPKEVENA